MYDYMPFDKTEDKKGVLYVVTAISNPCRYNSRYKLYESFAKMVQSSGAILITVEIAFGNRPFIVTKEDNPHHIQLRTNQEIWHKENMLNIGISKLPKDWQYVAWIDADVSFARPDWVLETIQQLQHYKIVQMFSSAFDLGPNFEPFQKHKGFVFSYLENLAPSKDYSNWHPGFAWAATRDAINDLGGLLDTAILGAADRHMAHALLEINQGLHKTLTDNYKNNIDRWQQRCNKHIKKNVGYVSGILFHYWHGKKKDRRYGERWSILTSNRFDPEIDLKRDWQGLWQLTERNLKLRDDIMKYFRARNEDSIDLDEQDIRI